jgi:glycosyltransferase involved in cell wall biosynthesis
MRDYLLTILIPTYNRALNLQKLLSSFVDNGLDLDVEMLVAINASNDGSKEIAQSYEKKLSTLKIKYFEDFVHSAEENISRSFQYCGGKYVFILGDDDIISKDVLETMLSILRKDKNNISALIFNNISSSNALSKLSDNVLKKESYEIEGMIFAENVVFRAQYSDLLKDLGLITTMAFISRYVIRKDLLRDFSSYINISRIYSHVFAFLDFFQKEDVIVVDLPLTIRGDSQVEERFDNMSNSTSQAAYFSWHYGLLKHIDNAIKNNFLSSSWLFDVKEINEDGSRFYLWSYILRMMVMQMGAYLGSFNSKEILDSKCLDLMVSLDNSHVLERDKKVLNYVLSQIRQALLVQQENFSSQEKKFIAWQIRKLNDLLYSNYHDKKNISFIKACYLRSAKGFYSALLAILKLCFPVRFLILYAKRNLCRAESQLLFNS